MAHAAPGAGLFAFHQLSHRVFDDIIHDVSRRIINPACFADFRFFLDFCLMPGGEPDHLAEELFINLSENVGRQDRKLVRTFRIIQIFENFL